MKDRNIGEICRDAVSLLREMVGVPSPSYEEDGVAGVICSFLERVGIGYSLEGRNIIALSKGFSAEKKTLMLNAHIDTVPPSQEYTFDPYHPEKEDVERTFGCPWEDIVCGLGSNDDGASVVALTAAFRYFQEDSEALPFNLALVLTCEEECSGPGGMTGLWKKLSGEQSLLGKGVAPEWAIIGEPTQMRAATSERGLLVIDATAYGVSGHAARDEGVNALYIALEDIETIRNIRLRKVSPKMGNVKMTVTGIQAGGPHNIVPDECRFTIDIRPTEQYSNKEIMDILQEKCRSRLTARNLRNKSSATMSGSPLEKCCESLGIERFSSPTTSDWMRIECDALKMGPGDSSRSHRKNEYVTVSEIEDGIKTYIGFIREMAGMV